MSKPVRDLPDQSRLTDDDMILHDHLCELLSDRFPEETVCSASTGIWIALAVMRDKLNLTLIERDAALTRVKDLTEAQERAYENSQYFNKIAKERDELRTELELAKASYLHSDDNHYWTPQGWAEYQAFKASCEKLVALLRSINVQQIVNGKAGQDLRATEISEALAAHQAAMDEIGRGRSNVSSKI